MNHKQLDFLMTNRVPREDGTFTSMEGLRAAYKALGHMVLDECKDSREKSLAITNLEQSLMWAIKSLALYEGVTEPHE